MAHVVLLGLCLQNRRDFFANKGENEATPKRVWGEKLDSRLAFVSFSPLFAKNTQKEITPVLSARSDRASEHDFLKILVSVHHKRDHFLIVYSQTRRKKCWCWHLAKRFHVTSHARLESNLPSTSEVESKVVWNIRQEASLCTWVCSECFDCGLISNMSTFLWLYNKMAIVCFNASPFTLATTNILSRIWRRAVKQTLTLINKSKIRLNCKNIPFNSPGSGCSKAG